MKTIQGDRARRMLHRRFALWTLAVVGASSTAIVAGCGDDASPSSAGDSGLDASGSDATTEAGLDSSIDRTVPSDAGNDQTTVETGSSEAGSDVGTDTGSEAGACMLLDAGPRDDASVQAGMLAVWTVYRCQGCHQRASQKVDDAGAGIVLSGNNDGLGDSGLVFPPNLTGDPATGLGCWTDGEILNAILHGKAMDGGATLCPSMPKWGNALVLADGGPRPGTPMDAGTAQSIVDFLRSLPVVNNKVMTTSCPMPQDSGSGGEAGDASDAGGTDAANAVDGNADAGSDAGTTVIDAGDGATE